MYDGKSVLEHMHYALLLSLLRHHDLGVLLDRPNFGPQFKKILFLTVLATDMGVHADFMLAFQHLVNSGAASSDLLNRRVLICQALIKCADISNPVRV